ncbi:hypothetical protein M2323_001030 [Rhodoblastus acidophilus]|uniref:hypothetical protein n=1 Tax=Rhodoblastus acidophilus TaxID=1074 RepID=UPI0022240A76|nr:hypothetical protein [Rhodoblastus acidophilus]MCW2283261.1 hypothetical protein [Rhodoblastus acidophilus]MCW2332121.1 hypothetical protein [Rhodoblastus acidophilus]
MTDEKLAELIEINLFFAKSELCQMADASAPARALLHIEEAMKELRNAKRKAAKNNDWKTNVA